VKKLLVSGAIPVVVALVIAGCGGGGSTSSGNTASSAPPAPPPSSAPTASAQTVGVTSGKLGTFLVDSKGKTLYLFEADKGNNSSCNGACASVWPPATTSGPPTAGPNVTAAKLGTTMRSDGKLQMTYNGHPLYYYVADTKTGDTTGQGLNQFGALWYVLAPNGNAILGAGSGSGAPSTQSAPPPSGGGY
jgi:predicted lipoprotein with Yx(FWY)xxD motif